MDEQRIQPTKDPTINSNDVLCGRGKTSFHHAGNRRFRDMITASISDYNNAHTRLEKSRVVNTIVENIRSTGGRFLKRDHATGKWNELDTRQSKEKVGHAIRDAASSMGARKKKKRKRKHGTDVNIDNQRFVAAIRGGDADANKIDFGNLGRVAQAINLSSWSSSGSAGSDDSLCIFEDDENDSEDQKAASVKHSDIAKGDESEKESNNDEDDLDGHFLAQINDVLGPMVPPPTREEKDPLQDFLGSL